MTSRSGTRPTQGDLLHVAVDTAWRFRAYGAYAEDPRKACRAMRRRCAGFAASDYATALSLGLALYDTVRQLVQDHAAELYAASDAGENTWTARFDDVLRAQFPRIRRETLHGLVGMMFFYWHLK